MKIRLAYMTPPCRFSEVPKVLTVRSIPRVQKECTFLSAHAPLMPSPPGFECKIHLQFIGPEHSKYLILLPNLKILEGLRRTIHQIPFPSKMQVRLICYRTCPDIHG